MTDGSPRQTTRVPRIAYRVHGERGSGVLLIMGLAMRGVVWRPQLDELAPRHRCVTYDHRGLGDSGPVSAAFSIADMAGDALGVLDDLGWDRVHLVGVSMGGMVAQELALAAPERVRSLALLVTHGGGRLAWLPRYRGARAFVTAWSRDPARRARGLGTLLYPDAYLRDLEPAQRSEALRERTEYAPPQGTVLRQVLAVSRHHTWSRLGALRMPTLVIKAGQDVLIHPAHSDRLAALIPGATLVTFPDAGHGVLFQRARDVNQRLLAHFAAAEV